MLAQFKHKSDVREWLDVIRGGYVSKAVEYLKTGMRPPFPYSDVRLLPYMQHSFWFLPSVAACHAIANLLREDHNVFWHDYDVLNVAGADAGIGLARSPRSGRRSVRASTQRRSPCRAASSPPVSRCRNGRRS